MKYIKRLKIIKAPTSKLTAFNFNGSFQCWKFEALNMCRLQYNKLINFPNHNNTMILYDNDDSL